MRGPQLYWKRDPDTCVFLLILVNFYQYFLIEHLRAIASVKCISVAYSTYPLYVQSLIQYCLYSINCYNIETFWRAYFKLFWKSWNFLLLYSFIRGSSCFKSLKTSQMVSKCRMSSVKSLHEGFYLNITLEPKLNNIKTWSPTQFLFPEDFYGHVNNNSFLFSMLLFTNTTFELNKFKYFVATI